MSLLLSHNTPDKAFPGFRASILELEQVINLALSCPLYSINLKPPQVTRQDSTEPNLKSFQVLQDPHQMFAGWSSQLVYTELNADFSVHNK